MSRLVNERGEPITDDALTERKRFCGNCRHREVIRKRTYTEGLCEITQEPIGYIETFYGWCPHWAKERFEKENE